ncbi:MAG: CCA tRNA nucleotidyltransferase [Erysipelothrix sp.]|nr:CCA tRNA nucleotidyltransferase [Erysipelothrix sp.]
MITPPLFINSCIKSINSSGYDAFLVGGWVRDALLGIESMDFDICTSAHPDIIKELFNHEDLNLQAQSLGSVSFIHEDMNIEFTTYRKEWDYTNGRHPNEIEFVNNLKTDLLRRDFTINTICYHPTEGVIDLLGGVNDLEAGVLRMVGDPGVRLNEDLLRIVRLFRFKAQLGFEIEESLLKSAYALSPKLMSLPPQSWRKEFFKLLLSDYFLPVALDDYFILGALIPDLGLAHEFDQLNPYHSYSLYEHSVRVCALLPKRLDLRIAGLFHDLGKLRVQVIDEDGIGHYRTHASVSREIMLEYLPQFELGNKMNAWILDLIQYHDYKLEESRQSIYAFTYRFGEAFLRDLLLLKIADNTTKTELAAYQVERCAVFSSLLDEVVNLPLVVSNLMIGNDDVLALGVPQNKVGKVLKTVLDNLVAGDVDNERDLQLRELKKVINNGIY